MPLPSKESSGERISVGGSSFPAILRVEAQVSTQEVSCFATDSTPLPHAATAREPAVIAADARGGGGYEGNPATQKGRRFLVDCVGRFRAGCNHDSQVARSVSEGRVVGGPEALGIIGCQTLYGASER